MTGTTATTPNPAAIRSVSPPRKAAATRSVGKNR